jgi:hypothetical protein
VQLDARLQVSVLTRTCHSGTTEGGVRVIALTRLTPGPSEEEAIAATTCALTAADADAGVPVVGSCAAATGSGTCDYLAPAAGAGVHSGCSCGPHQAGAITPSAAPPYFTSSCGCVPDHRLVGVHW